MKAPKTIYIILLFAWLALATGCSSSSGAIDKLLGQLSSAPILTTIPDQVVAEDDPLKIDVNNIKEFVPGDDKDMSYTCKYDKVVADESVSYSKNCADLPGTGVSFSATSGILLWTPHVAALGNYKFRITGTNTEGTYEQNFSVGVRLKFSGIATFSSITGTSVTATWVPNAAAQAYQIFKLNTLTNLYELFTTVSSGAASGYNITGLVPNTGYTFRVQAVDVLGHADGNVVSRSVTTTQLVKLSMSASVSTLAAGTPTTISVQAYNVDDSPQTVGGLPLSALIASGTSTGNFSAFVDNNDGTYTFSFTPTIVGTAIRIEVSILSISFYLNSTVTLTTIPGPASSANSSISLAASSVTSNTSVLATAVIRDVYNNNISSGSTITFNKTGGTSTGTFSAVTNAGSGTYTTNYTGIVAGTAQTLTVSVDGVALTPSTTIQVLPGLPVSATSTLAISSATLSSGSDATVTATLKDVNSNLVSSGILVAFNKSGGTSSGNYSGVVNAGSGQYTTHYTGVVSGTAQTLSVSVNGAALTPTVTVTVVPGPASLANSSYTISNASVVSGNFVTATATLKDAANNPIDSGIVVSFTKTGGTSTGTFGAVQNQGNGVYNIRYTGVGAGTAQSLNLFIDSVAFATPVTISVTNGAPSATTSTLAVASPTVSSGNAVTVTATLRDDNNNLVSSGYTVTLIKTGGTSTGTFDVVTNAGNGVYTSTYTGVGAGTAQTLNLQVNGVVLGPTTTIAVTTGAPSSLLSTFTISSNSVIAGSNVTLTATIKDANSNPISSGILVMFDKTGGTSFGNFDTVVNQGNGIYTVHYSGVTAGTAQTLQANVNGAGFGPTQTIQVLVGAPSLTHSSLTLSSNSIASGTISTITAVIHDSQNNPITNQYAISFDAIGGSSTGNLSVITTPTPGTFVTTYTGINSGSAQTIRVLADAAAISGLTGSLTVVSGPVNAGNSTFTIGSGAVQSGSSTPINILLRDVNSNPISAGATLTFNKTASVSDGTISAVTNVGSGNYSATYTGTTMGSAQTINLLVNGASVGMSVVVSVTAGAPKDLAITGPVNPIPSIDCNGPYTITLKDINNNTTVSTSTVSVALTSTPSNSHVDTLFSDANCTAGLTAFSIPASTSTYQFYYKSFTPQSFTLNLAPNHSINATTLAIASSPVLSWIGASAYFTMNGSGTNTVMDDTSGGSGTPQDVAINGDYMYAVDIALHRIIKYNITTNTMVGWIGHVGSLDNITTFDGSTACQSSNLTDLTPKWCLGGRSNTITAAVINAPRVITTDATYIYVVAGSHRILRFLQSDGSYQGWFGRINSVAGLTPAACVTAGVGATTPTWCYGGGFTAGALDGQFNTVTGITYFNNYLYVTDYNNQRVQRIDISTANPFSAGWVGQVGTTAPPAAGQLATCTGSPTQGAATPGWCLGGTTQTAVRYNIQGPCTAPCAEVPAPNEGFYNPYGITNDGTYLYLGDYSNHRVVRLNLSTGAFAGWIGNVLRGNSLSPTTPAQTNGAYTTQWVQGGAVAASSGTNGFGYPTNLVVDTTVVPNQLYITNSGYHRVVRVQAADGQDFRWIGRTSASPTGGYTGCSSTPIGAVTPGWCTGGTSNRAGNANTAMYNPFGLALSATKLYVADTNNFRIQSFTKSTGVFAGWIGGGNLTASKWSRTIASGSTPGYGGIDDYSTFTSTNWDGLAISGNSLFQTDYGVNRIKRFNKLDGSIVGYIGQISGFPPTGPEACQGYTSGMTPTWCTGGGRTGSGSGIHGYSNPYSVAADSDYAYIGNYSNARIDRVRISDGTYLGWIGRISTVPTDGDTGCTTALVGATTPGWCIGGLASAANATGQFNGVRVLHHDGTNLYAIDNTDRLIRIDPSNGNQTGVVGTLTAATGCTLSATTGPSTTGWCATATGGGASTAYGGIGNYGNGIASNTNYIFVADIGNQRITRFEKATGLPAGVIGLLSNATNLNTAAATFTVNSLITTNGCFGLAAGGYPKATPGWCLTNSIGQGMATNNGTGNNMFATPRGIYADDNFIYVSDTLNNRVVKINAVTGAFVGWRGFVATTAGMSDSSCIAALNDITPTWCAGGTAGPGKKLGAFDTPTGITGDSNYIYVLDSHNNRTVTIPK